MYEKTKEPINNYEVAIKSITPSGFFGDSENLIFEIENFMTIEEQNFLLNFAMNNKDWDYTKDTINENGVVLYQASVWKDRVASLPTLSEYAPNVVDVIYKMIERLKIEVDKEFKINAQATSPAIVRWPPGTRQEPHADKEFHEGPNAGTPNAFPYYDMASIFYINDDYEGGELYFPLQGIEFKPKARAVYFFPGDKNFIHGVRPVISGTRYTSPFFWTILEHTGE
jgi:hypothetical protein